MLEDKFTNPTRHLSHIPQYIFHDGNVYYAAHHCAFSDMGQVHYGICETGLYRYHNGPCNRESPCDCPDLQENLRISGPTIWCHTQPTGFAEWSRSRTGSTMHNVCGSLGRKLFVNPKWAANISKIIFLIILLHAMKAVALQSHCVVWFVNAQRQKHMRRKLACRLFSPKHYGTQGQIVATRRAQKTVIKIL